MVVIEASEQKFLDIAEDILRSTSTGKYSSDWYKKLKSLRQIIIETNQNDNVTLSDDRLIMASWTMLQNIFYKPSMREWWIAHRYLEVFGNQKNPLVSMLHDYVDKTIAYNSGLLSTNDFFAKTYSKEDDIKYMEIQATLLNEFSETNNKNANFVIPLFIWESLQNKEVEDETEDEDAGEDLEMTPLSKSERKEWSALKSATESLIEQHLPDHKSRQSWDEIIEICNLMLNQ